MKLSDQPEELIAIPAIVQGDYDTARVNLEILIKRAREQGDVLQTGYLLQVLGDVEAKAGNIELAHSLHAEALELDPGHPLPLLFYAKGLLRSFNRPDLALLRLNELEELLASRQWVQSDDEPSRDYYETEVATLRREISKANDGKVAAVTDNSRASKVAQDGLELWGKGQLLDAAECFREAIDLADRTHYRTPDYHSSLACILAELKLDMHALTEFREALRIAIEQGTDDASPAIAIARYFLGEHLLKLHRETEALSCVAKSLLNETALEPLLRIVEADSLWRLGRKADALNSAQKAIETAKSEEQRERVRDRLSEILGESAEADD